MELLSVIRRWHYRDQFSIREISRRTGLSGSNVTEDPARSYAHSVVAIHLTDVPFWNMFQKSTNLSRAEAALLKEAEQWQKERGAYAMIQGTRPATAAVGLGDSPSGLSAWIVEKFHEWSDCGGDIETRFSKDELLTNVTIYWCTETIESSFLPYHDFMTAGAAGWRQKTGSAQEASRPRSHSSQQIFPIRQAKRTSRSRR